MIWPWELGTATSYLCLYVSLSLFTSAAQAEVKVLPASFDPQTGICYRYGHQTAVIDNRLYVDGGIIQIEKSNPTAPQDNANYSNPDFFYFDLSTRYRDSVDVRQPPFITDKLRKKPGEVPSLEGATLWTDAVNKKLYLYGGQFTTSPPSPFALWSYDAIYDTWASINQSRDASGTPVGVARLYNGAAAVSEAAGMAYYFGGWIDRESEYAYDGKQAAVAGLLVYDMVNNVWRNQTVAGTGGINIGRRAEGVMIYVPLGDEGILVAFGGVRVSEDGRTSAVPMSEITIYNIGSRQWYVQNATGDVPESRRLFCAGLASGTLTGWDGSKQPLQNIYLYGGASTYSDPGFDDVYILTLPNFVWTKFWPVDDSTITRRPHQRLTCNVIQNSQMLILGGYFPLGGECDTPGQAAIHNLNLSGSNSEGTIWANYAVGLDDYQVPSAVLDTLEAAGPVIFNHPDISVIVSKTAPASSRTPTRNVSGPTKGLSSRDRTIVLATAIPGGILIIVLLFFCIRWYKHRAVATSDFPTPVAHDTYTHNPDQLHQFPPASPTVQPPALALVQSPSLSHSTYTTTSTIPIIQQLPVAYVVNPAGGFTPVYNSPGPTVSGAASPPMELTSTSVLPGTPHGYGQIYAQGYQNSDNDDPTKSPVELSADQSKSYGAQGLAL
ncbi:hypothetical protein TWF481_004517 [Arthrobotrys musiformis]|uniref:Kelch repeat-containing protein n=1 Tax=Arthrobotrys musiformis TaxID=47236 RepID=A0AAV9WQI7_9PEZI